MWIDDSFPDLSPDRYTITSNPTDEYNCIAWAAGENTSWWSHLPGYQWPGAIRDQTIESLVAMFSEIGYEVCDNAFLEDGFEKVAVYEKAGLWKHAARQLPNGRWTSKLGPDEDIEHQSPDDLSGNLYGVVYSIMRKKKG